MTGLYRSNGASLMRYHFTYRLVNDPGGGAFAVDGIDVVTVPSY